ncbi:hypothetical protein LTR85_006788 [Meristemomyces frigidus]|nr:hypothetical protein LTR85_006788 [Meristemomyces frigidus]
MDSRFDAVGEESGGDCAAQSINDLLLDLVESSEGMRVGGGTEEVAKSLGMTEHAFRRSMLQSIEDFMLKFEERGTFQLMIRAIQAAFDAVGSAIIRMLDAQSQNVQLKAIVVTGGLSKSMYLMKMIREKYEKTGIFVARVFEFASGECFHVPLGALYRYHNITQQRLPRKYSYAFVQDEYYDPNIHPDATAVGKERVIRNDEWTGKYRTTLVRDRTIAKTSPHNSKGKEQYIVNARLKLFLPKEQVVSGNNVPLAFDQIYFLNVKKPKLSTTIVYLEGDFATHQPARTPNWQYRPGIVELNKVARMLDPADLKNRGYQIRKNSDGESEYRVTASVIPRYNGERDMSVGWTLKSNREGQKEVIIWEDETTLWDASHSIFVGEPERKAPIKNDGTTIEVDDDPMTAGDGLEAVMDATGDTNMSG